MPLPPPSRVPVQSTGNDSVELAIEKVITALLTAGPAEAQRVAAELLQDQQNPVVDFLFERVRASTPGAAHSEEALIRIAETLPDFVEPAVDLVQIYTAKRAVQELIECYVVMYERQLSLLGEQLQVVRQLAQDGKFDAAMGPIAELASWAPVTAGGHRRVGRSLLTAGDRDRAFHHLFLAHLSTFWDFESTYDYAVAAVHNAQVELARELLGQILKMAPAVHPVVERARALMLQLSLP